MIKTKKYGSSRSAGVSTHNINKYNSAIASSLQEVGNMRQLTSNNFSHTKHESVEFRINIHPKPAWEHSSVAFERPFLKINAR